MTLSRSPIKPGAPMKRHTRLVRKAPLRQRSSKPSAKRRKAAQEGPQWRLCHETECVACYHARFVRQWGRDVAVAWSCLGPGTDSHGHHEPPRSLGGTDAACLPLCHVHHEQRHRMGFTAFWLCIDVEGALAEMRRRVALQHPKPVVDATEETTP